MSGYNDGTSFGYDEINPYDHIPISFEQISLPSGTQFLASQNEYPIFSTTTPSAQMHTITDQSLVTRATTPLGMVEGFRDAPIAKFNKDDVQLILIFIVIVIGILQIKMMIQMDKINMIMQYGAMHNRAFITPSLAQ